MRTSKYGILGLMLGATLLAAACDSETTTPPPAVTVTVSPDPVPALNIGQTVQMVAVVANSTNQQVTWTSSTPAVASVSATGLVTALTQGVTVITATSVADPNAKDAVTVQVNPPAAPPTISIKSVTTGNLNTPVDPNNVFGQIDVTLNVEVPAGAQVERVETLIDGNVVCSQSFQGGADITEGDEANAPQVEIVCSINTAAFNATTGVPTFPNGPHTLTARLVQPGGNIIATPSTTLIFNNSNFLVVSFTGERSAIGAAGPRSVAPVGSQWLGGDITANVTNVNYGGAANAVASLTISLTSSGDGSTGVSGCVSTTNAATNPTIADDDGGAGGDELPECDPETVSQTATASGAVFTVVFPSDENMDDGGFENVEDVFRANQVVVTSTTAGGQPGPVCINPTPVQNPQGPTCQTFFAANLNIDNLAPRVTELDIVRPNQYYNEDFVPEHTADGGTDSCTAPCARTVDYGVDAQTAAGNTLFFAGASASTLVDVTAGFGPLDETQVASTNLFQLVTSDALDNTRTVYATANEEVVNTSATAGSNLKFGIDNTDPTLTVVSGPPDGSTNCGAPPSDPPGCAGPLWDVDFSDAGIGPSGFNTNPVRVKLELILEDGTTCVDDGGNEIDCDDDSPYADDGLIAGVVNSGEEGYWRLTVTVEDAAGNSSTEQVIVTLLDFTEPVAGGIASPASIAGGAAVTFSSALEDNVELGDVLGATRYSSGFTLVDSRQTIGTYGPDEFDTTSAGTFNVASFVRSVETTTAAGLPTGTVSPATIFEYAARDVAGVQTANVFDDDCPAAGAADGSTTRNCILRVVNISAAVNLGSSNTFPAFSALNTLNGANAAHGLFVHQPESDDPVCTHDDCNTAPETTTFTATLTGPAATFANPFSRVIFAMLDAQGRWFPIGTAQVSVSDNTVLNTRTFTFSFEWNPDDDLPDGAVVQIRAIGIASTGSALMSQNRAVTLEDD